CSSDLHGRRGHIMRSSHLAIPVALLSGAIATGPLTARQAETLSPQGKTFFESCAPVRDAEVCTWVTMEGGSVIELGATLPMKVVEGVPADAEMVWPPEQLAAVPLPSEARSTLGIDHLGINWEAHGHPPAPFLVPHFDFHFYTLSQADIRAIDCSDSRKPRTLPAGHVLPDIEVPGLGTLIGLCVPRMGMHAMPAEEIEGGPFEATMIIGYYAGRPIYFEPMVSRERLLRRTDFALALPPIHDLPAGVRYPSRLRAMYDTERAGYRLVFTGF
ncbi:MAG: hypothetical protein R3266_04125, partial [Gemmatimonadota bacterium]|nr:hypothetical protein [Gemmatimonadota bacterium]